MARWRNDSPYSLAHQRKIRRASNEPGLSAWRLPSTHCILREKQHDSESKITKRLGRHGRHPPCSPHWVTLTPGPLHQASLRFVKDFGTSSKGDALDNSLVPRPSWSPGPQHRSSFYTPASHMLPTFGCSWEPWRLRLRRDPVKTVGDYPPASLPCGFPKAYPADSPPRCLPTLRRFTGKGLFTAQVKPPNVQG